MKHYFNFILEICKNKNWFKTEMTGEEIVWFHVLHTMERIMSELAGTLCLDPNLFSRFWVKPEQFTRSRQACPQLQTSHNSYGESSIFCWVPFIWRRTETEYSVHSPNGNATELNHVWKPSSTHIRTFLFAIRLIFPHVQFTGSPANTESCCFVGGDGQDFMFLSQLQFLSPSLLSTEDSGFSPHGLH